jgi:hypothetical protein
MVTACLKDSKWIGSSKAILVTNPYLAFLNFSYEKSHFGFISE